MGKLLKVKMGKLKNEDTSS